MDDISLPPLPNKKPESQPLVPPEVALPPLPPKKVEPQDVLGLISPVAGISKQATQGKLTSEQVGRLVDVAKGIPGGVTGIPSELYNLFLPGSEARTRSGLANLGYEISQQNVLPYSKYTPSYITEKLFGKPETKGEAESRAAGEAAAGVAAPFALTKILGAAEMPFVNQRDPLSGLRSKVEQMGAAGEEAVTGRAISAVDRRLDQVPQLKETIRSMTPDVENRVSLARKETGIVNPDTIEAFNSGKDINTDASSLISTKYKSAEQLQRQVGGTAFENYRTEANFKQNTQPFGESAQGKTLQKELDTIISGGEGDLRKFGKAEIDLARQIRSELFGRKPEDISVKEIEDVASRLPKSFSQSARENQARNIILEKEARGRRPVDFKIVDNKLRELRQIEASKTLEAATAIARGRYKNAADLVEDALKNWVGEENYPRQTYAESSKELNDLQEKLALAARQRGAYEKGAGELVVKDQPVDVMFKNRRNAQLSKDLYGEKEVSALAERHASNEIYGKSGDQIKEWLRSPKSSFTREIPGLPEKIEQYANSLIRREKDVGVLEALQKRLSGVPSEITGFGEQAQKATNLIKDAVERVKTEEPAKLYDAFVKDIRPNLEQTGVYTRSELDTLQEEISAASRKASRDERVSDMTRALFKAGLKLTGVGGVLGTIYKVATSGD